MLTRLALVLLLASAAVAQSTDALIAELTARGPRNRVRRDKARPQVVYGAFGNLADPATAGPLQTAYGFLEKYGVLFGLPAGTRMPGELEVLRDEKREDGHDLELVPAKNGVPYLAGALTFAFGRDGKLVAAHGRYRSVAGAGTGSLDAGQAARRALEVLAEELPGSQLSADGTVHEYLAAGEGDSLQHCYSVELPLGETRLPERVVLGPGGELIAHVPSASAYDGTGKAYTTHPGNTLGTVTLTNLVKARRGASPLKGEFFTPVSPSILHAASKDGSYDYPPRLGGELGVDLLWYDPRFLEVNVYHHLMIARKHAIEVGKVAVDTGRPQRYNAWMYPDAKKPSSMNNAFYVNSSREWFFPVINPGLPMEPLLFRTAAVDASVIYHEYGHHVLNMLTPHIHGANTTVEELYESMAINEGFADFFSHTITGSEKVAEVFGAGSPKLRSVGQPGADKCKLRDFIIRAITAVPDQLPSAHVGGIVFATICRDVETVFGAATLPLVLRALKSTTPRTFTKFSLALETAVESIDDGAHSTDIGAMLEGRRVYDTDCDFGRSPLPRGMRAAAETSQ